MGQSQSTASNSEEQANTTPESSLVQRSVRRIRSIVSGHPYLTDSSIQSYYLFYIVTDIKSSASTIRDSNQ